MAPRSLVVALCFASSVGAGSAPLAPRRAGTLDVDLKSNYSYAAEWHSTSTTTTTTSTSPPSDNGLAANAVAAQSESAGFVALVSGLDRLWFIVGVIVVMLCCFLCILLWCIRRSYRLHDATSDQLKDAVSELKEFKAMHGLIAVPKSHSSRDSAGRYNVVSPREMELEEIEHHTLSPRRRHVANGNALAIASHDGAATLPRHSPSSLSPKKDASSASADPLHHHHHLHHHLHHHHTSSGGQQLKAALNAPPPPPPPVAVPETRGSAQRASRFTALRIPDGAMSSVEVATPDGVRPVAAARAAQRNTLSVQLPQQWAPRTPQNSAASKLTLSPPDFSAKLGRPLHRQLSGGMAPNPPAVTASADGVAGDNELALRPQQISKLALASQSRCYSPSMTVPSKLSMATTSRTVCTQQTFIAHGSVAEEDEDEFLVQQMAPSLTAAESKSARSVATASTSAHPKAASMAVPGLTPKDILSLLAPAASPDHRKGAQNTRQIPAFGPDRRKKHQHSRRVIELFDRLNGARKESGCSTVSAPFASTAMSSSCSESASTCSTSKQWDDSSATATTSECTERPHDASGDTEATEIVHNLDTPSTNERTFGFNNANSSGSLSLAEGHCQALQLRVSSGDGDSVRIAVRSNDAANVDIEVE